MRFGAWLLIFLRKEQYRMKLVLAEKPSVAMSLSKVIGADQRGDGYMEGNGYLVSWCVGHLVELVVPVGLVVLVDKEDHLLLIYHYIN
jgi:DNA topoisomerase-3